MFLCCCPGSQAGSSEFTGMQYISNLKLTHTEPIYETVEEQNSIKRKVKRILKQNSIKTGTQSSVWVGQSYKAKKSSVGIESMSVQWRDISKLGQIQPPSQLLIFPASERKRLLLIGLQNQAIAFSILSRNLSIFHNFLKTNQNVYKSHLKIEAQIREIKVDSFIPVNQKNQPCFICCDNSQLWYSILEKMRASSYGSYAKLITNSQSTAQIIQQLTFAPNLTRFIDLKNGMPEKLWPEMVIFWKKYPFICCTTNDKIENQSKQFILPNHCYSLVKMAELQINKTGQKIKILEIGNSFKGAIWKNEGNSQDTYFWNKIRKNEIYNQFYKNTNENTNYILYKDFNLNFSKIEINLFSHNAYFTNQPLSNYKNNKGDYFEVYVQNQSVYNFQITQLFSNQKLDYNRGTIIVFSKKNAQFDYQQGSLSKKLAKTFLKVRLSPGTYIIYAKIDKAQSQIFPQSAKIQLYSTEPVELSPVKESKYRTLLDRGFLSLGRITKRQQYHKKSIWMSFQEISSCDYGFIAFGNQIVSNQKIIVKFDEKDFLSSGYKLKKPYKRLGYQQLIIMPGEQKIILCRKINSFIKQAKFPPKMQFFKQPV